MSLSPSVPPEVPAARRRARGAGGSRPPRYLTGDPSGWRFQIRLPKNLFGDGLGLAKTSLSLRVNLGPRGRGEAKRLALQLAALCQAVFAMAAASKETVMIDPQSPGSSDSELAHQVIAACQSAIARAVSQPSRALGLARGLDSALTSLKLVQSEVDKGAGGARAVVDNAEALTRHALKDVLKLADDPQRALEALATAPAIVPAAPPREPAPPGGRRMPTFGEVSLAYIDMRIANDGPDHPDIQYLRMRRRTFIDIIGDRPVDEYYPRDLQTYVSRMQHWPANAVKRGEFENLSTLEILEANRDFQLKPIARKTLQDGYAANVKTMMRAGMADFHYRDPFAGSKIRWPQMLQQPVPREGIGLDVLDRVFRIGTQSGVLVEAMLPLLSALTSRRLGLLTYMRGSDIREKHGVMIAQTGGIVLENGRWRRVPVKTEESMTFFVLHDFFTEIGFVDWARRQDGWVFAAAHEHPNPSKYISKVMNKLLRRCGAVGGAEVFHSLRGDAISAMRDAEVQGRAVRLQAGHELGDVHDQYGFRALSASECKRLARLPLPKEINWNVFRGLDYDALAAHRRGPGRRRR